MLEKEPVIDEGCENAKEVASKYGYNIVCDDDELEETRSDDENCENAKEVASKHGYTVVCEDEE